MSRHKVELTGVNTANIEVLSSEEMTKLLKEYKAGNTAVKDRLVTGNLKLVLSILKRFTKKEENMDDLISQMAELIIEQNRTIIGSDIADDAINRVKEENQQKKEQEKKEEGGTEINVKEKAKRRRTTKTA